MKINGSSYYSPKNFTNSTNYSISDFSVSSATANTVIVFNSSKNFASSSISSTQLNYLSNVTSDIQAQINSKLSIPTTTITFSSYPITLATTANPTGTIFKLNINSTNNVFAIDNSGNITKCNSIQTNQIYSNASYTNFDGTTGENSFKVLILGYDSTSANGQNAYQFNGYNAGNVDTLYILPGFQGTIQMLDMLLMILVD